MIIQKRRKEMIEMRSVIDNSINLISNPVEGEYIESRYVYREDSDHAIIYLSSQTGCDKSCKYCWLTQTGQTNYRDCSVEEILMQVDSLWDKLPLDKITKIHFNFMARGEALSSNIILKNFDDLIFGFRERCKKVNKECKVLISTILPKGIMTGETLMDITKILSNPEVHLYYSLYGNDTFRNKWMGKAESLNNALSALHVWHMMYPERIVLHWAFIDGENTDIDDFYELAILVKQYLRGVRINIVRFNPIDEKYKEPSLDVIQNLFSAWNFINFNSRNKIIPRVGVDVYASCGMFFAP